MTKQALGTITLTQVAIVVADEKISGQLVGKFTAVGMEYGLKNYYI